ncbi:N-acetylneuraminate synthase [Blautia faecis]|uniref:N-acetylneuraminate synthase n=1 Tax=Clostridia TaxID=186801 RepID=UPI001654EC2E|nr:MULTISPECIES: N-acetylneuraminate synthase [Clostridia]MBC8615208.1 N-acetylneuraminate synthase [Blautia faecis]MCB5481549.1 N-acetylneuraminate synthase [Blautia faecis]MDB8773683.1 N-acetylneuraminate synthase [Ruminococcus sp. 1001136sp1]MDB8782323.1 N-acetylneuraminate synthase [Ruminococcus sp. 1001136sp1]
MKHVFIVAEIGCNHNGSKDLAREMVIKAKECGVDAVKFQTFKADALISCYAPKAEYQKETTGTVESQLEMTKKLELSHDDLIELKAYAESLGLVVFSTPFDLDSVDFLNSIGQSLWKIPSGEITNLPYLKRIGAIKIDNKKIILSSGMATIDEIKTCIGVLVEAGTNENDIILLHCNTEYPTPDKDVNILAINDLKEQFPNVSIGFSDHSVGYVAAVGAAILGVSLIEKHFTLDKNFAGPDHKASATPEELKALVENVRRIEVMAGSSKKIVTESERKNKIVARKSIVAARNIVKGEILTEENITCKRPGNGISPMKWYDILGKVAEKDFRTDELIEQSGFEWQEC